ncbi:4-hydroxy-tetrahydrodipicolinate synthase [Hwanghaeella grinnelliae]|uniref:4-hydroxy-tetrahydrodipicolinate synthase n=1 Tax=Hwanghaeella grinnelliae TaxID=2500179 RepID=A0A437QL83_9PROT|nr:4-hydroxy-tetrahydrodipicolinate synthase [Hwanghaeella grinnelliae]RVU35275.1 4-hydroxy-tetrahydrodipicolinate synthase [Hwanghaeella grinnelliae]
MFQGSMTALITPMTDTGAIDEKAFQAFVEWQLAEGTEGLIPVGTTGESPTLSHAEHERVVDLCIEAAGGRAPVIAGSGSNNTEEAIHLTKHAKQAGASAALVVTPYYNKPTQAGLYGHYAAIAKAVDIPIIIYNIPGRSIIDMSVETMAKLAKDFPNIVGVKDATNDLNRPVLTRLAIGDDFSQLSGEDGTIGAFLGQGGHGCISVTSNIAPGLCAKLHAAWRAKDYAAFAEVRDRLMPVHGSMFCESSPGPVKYGASLLGKSNAFARLPMVEIAQSSKDRVKAAMQGAGLL